MNQLDNKKSDGPDLYIFDCDGVLYKHENACYGRMRDVGAKVIQAYTGLDYDAAYAKGCESWELYADGFFALKDEYGPEAYHAMHRHFDMVSRLDVSGSRENDLPRLIAGLADYADICVLSHTTTHSLRMILTRLGYSPAFVQNHAFGIDAFGNRDLGRKDVPCSGVFNRICDRYKTTPERAVIIEDSVTNLNCAAQKGIKRRIFVDWGRVAAIPQDGYEAYRSTAMFVRRERDRQQARHLVAC